jgi:hypothetical protein
MGRTLPSATQVFFEEEARFRPFKRALCGADQHALDELFDYANWHIAEAGYAAHPLPMRIFLMAMLMEQQKEIRRLRELIERLERGETVELEAGSSFKAAGAARQTQPSPSYRASGR